MRVSDPALEAIDVGVRYPGGGEALRGVSLAIRPGETVGLVGESGSGKTTLLRLFNATVRPTSGSVEVDGASIESVDPIALRRATGYVQQEGGLLPHWNVLRNVTLVPRLLGVERTARERRAKELLELVGLDPTIYAERFPAQLSGGQRQRVAFARALAGDPPVVLLDEPFGALDAITRRELQRQFGELRATLGKTMLFVTHDLDEAFRLADRIGVLREGELLQFASADELRSAPAHDYVRKLVALA